MAVLTVLLSGGCVLAVVLYLCHRWQHRHILAVATKLPCPPSLPVLGNALFFMDDTTKINTKLTKLVQHYKGMFCLWLGPTPLFVISTPTDVKRVLTTSSALEKDTSYDYMKRFLGNGLVCSPVSLWKKDRHLIGPIFHPSNIETFISVFNDASKDLVKSYISNDIGRTISLKDGISSLTLRAAFETVIGFKSNPTKNMEEDIKYLFHWEGESFVRRVMNPFLHFDWIFSLINRTNVKRSEKYLSNLKYIIRQKLHKFEVENKPNEGECQTDIGKPATSMLSVITNDSQRTISEIQWIDDIITIMAGASDTMNSLINLLLFTLANHPDIQTKVYLELRDIGDSKDDLTIEDIQRLNYLEQVIFEVMRLHGTVPIILRRTTGPIKLGEVTLPAGCRLLIPLQAMGWDPEVFPDPHLFRPERFSPDVEREVRPLDVFMPFSAGPRNCIGKTYALLLLKCTLAHILRQYRVSTSMKMEDIEYQLEIVMSTKSPLFISFHER